MQHIQDGLVGPFAHLFAENIMVSYDTHYLCTRAPTTEPTPCNWFQCDNTSRYSTYYKRRWWRCFWTMPFFQVQDGSASTAGSTAASGWMLGFGHIVSGSY